MHIVSNLNISTQNAPTTALYRYHLAAIVSVLTLAALYAKMDTRYSDTAATAITLTKLYTHAHTSIQTKHTLLLVQLLLV
jgi:hypothetical protein